MMRIALVESHIVWENKEKNLRNAKRDLELLKDRGIQLVLFPEMSFTGFSMNTNCTKEDNMESIRLVQEWTQEYQITIGCGWVKNSGDKCENHYTLVNQGAITADYIKMHPFSYSGEDKYFTKGNKLSICNVDNFVVGLQICYDLRFPEVFQILSKKASLIIVPANWPKRRKEHWNCLLKARAIENQVYLAGINCVGIIGDLEYSGDTQIIAPDGNVCLPKDTIQLEKDNIYIYIYEIDNDVSDYRNSFPVKQDRQEELYKNLSV